MNRIGILYFFFIFFQLKNMIYLYRRNTIKQHFIKNKTDRKNLDPFKGEYIYIYIYVFEIVMN